MKINQMYPTKSNETSENKSTQMNHNKPNELNPKKAMQTNQQNYTSHITPKQRTGKKIWSIQTEEECKPKQIK